MTQRYKVTKGDRRELGNEVSGTKRSLGFVLLDDGAPAINQVLYERAKKKDTEYARELLEWSRTLDDHGLTFSAWKESRGRMYNRTRFNTR